MKDDREPMPINMEENIKTRDGIEAGSVQPVCFYCKANPCYELSYQNKNFVKTFLYDEKRLVCPVCYNFMNVNGRWVTKILRVLLKVDVLIRRKLN